jgi:radical SAM protein (TIGR01212 family)
LAQPKVVGIAIGTRPDCVPDEVLDYLAELSQQTYLSLELGMQTMHDRSLDWMNRGHHHDVFLDAVARCQARGLELCAHLILGLPGESHEDMLQTAREVARLGLRAVKIHNLYVVKNTALADWFRDGEVTLMERDDYIRTLVDVIEVLPQDCVLERVSGEAPPDYFIAPGWSLDKPALRAALDAEMERRDTWQGRNCLA